MTVHIDELHSEVVPANGRPANKGEQERQEPDWIVRDRWLDARRRQEALAERVRAVDFDD